MKPTWERILAGESQRPRSNDWEGKRNLVQAIADEIDAVRDLVTASKASPDTRFQEAAALVREAIAAGHHMVDPEPAFRDIEKALEALEKEA